MRSRMGVAAVALIMLVGACNQGGTGGSNEFTFGFSATLTGEFASFGTNMQ
jgi:hypothetical protein